MVRSHNNANTFWAAAMNTALLVVVMVGMGVSLASTLA